MKPPRAPLAAAITPGVQGYIDRLEARMAEMDRQWKPNPGPQSAFMKSRAFEVLYGGQVGGGKSEALLQWALRGVHEKNYRAILFRRNFPDLEKSLIARSQDAYRRASNGQAVYNEQKKSWRFPSGARIYFGHLDIDKSVYAHQSAEYQSIGFDELTHFTEFQYTYMLTRARGTNIPREIRAATNPGGEGHDWVVQRWAPWLIPHHTPDADPSEVLKFRGTADGEEWDETGSLTRTFIPASRFDTPQLDAEYEQQFGGLDAVTRSQLLMGDWLVKPAAGLYFRREWVSFVDELDAATRQPSVPARAQRVRFWDKAASEPSKTYPDPDWTVGVRMAYHAGTYYIEDVVRMRGGPGAVEKCIAATAEMDGKGVPVRMAQDPGSAGKGEVATYARLLVGYAFGAKPETGDKVTRFGAFSAQANPISTGGEKGRVCVVRGEWNKAYLESLEGFPEARHDDDADATSGAFGELAGNAIARILPPTRTASTYRLPGNSRGFG